jgi:hypothetical protein
LDYIITVRSLVEQQQMQSTAEVGGEERSAHITEVGKTRIKSELQRLYPNYLHVAAIPLPVMLDLNIDAVAKEISQEK